MTPYFPRLPSSPDVHLVGGKAQVLVQDKGGSQVIIIRELSRGHATPSAGYSTPPHQPPTLSHNHPANLPTPETDIHIRLSLTSQ